MRGKVEWGVVAKEGSSVFPLSPPRGNFKGIVPSAGDGDLYAI